MGNGEASGIIRCVVTHPLPEMYDDFVAYGRVQDQEKYLLNLTRFNKIAITNNKFQMASGQRSHWLIESPTISSSTCNPPLSNICKFYF